MCLVKDPTKRPSAEKLLKHAFFLKHVKGSEDLDRQLLQRLPPLEERIRMLKAQDAAMLAAKMTNLTQQEEISHCEYEMGVSGWKFDVEDLKAQAALLPDEPEAAQQRAGSEKVAEGKEEAEGPGILPIPEDHSVRQGAALFHLQPQQQQQQQLPNGHHSHHQLEHQGQQQGGQARHSPRQHPRDPEPWLVRGLDPAQAPPLEQEGEEAGEQEAGLPRVRSEPLGPGARPPPQAPGLFPVSCSLTASRSHKELRGRFEVTHGDDSADDEDFGSDDESS